MNYTQQKIALQGIDGLTLVNSHEVLYAIADGNYTSVNLTDKRQVKVLRRLEEVGQLLPSDNFCRIHRSHLVNLEQVIRFNADGTESVLMTNGESLEVARDRKVEFIEKFTRI